MADDAVRAKAAKILADVRAGTHSHGDIRDVGKLLDGKWDQDFPTALLEIASRTLNNSDDALRAVATIKLEDISPCADIFEAEFPQKVFIRAQLEMAVCKVLAELYHRGYRAHTLAGAGECESRIAANLWNNLCEKDDRSSPEDYPDHCLITREELSSYISEAFEAGRSTNTALTAARSEMRERAAKVVEYAPHKGRAVNRVAGQVRVGDVAAQIRALPLDPDGETT